MSILWIAQRTMREVLRDWRTVAFFFLVPVAVMILVYIALAKDDVARVAIVYRGLAQSVAEPLETALAQEYGVRRVDLPALEAPTGSRMFATVLDEPGLNAKITDALSHGDADAIVLLSAAFTNDRMAGKPGIVTIYVEGSRPQLTAQVRQAFLQAAAVALPSLVGSSGPYARGLALPTSPTQAGPPAQAANITASSACPAACGAAAMPDLRVSYLHGGASYRLVDYFLPTLLPFFVFFFTFMVSTITFQRERTRGTLERIMIAPVTLLHVVAGYVLGFSAFCLAQVAIVLGFILALISFPVTAGQVAALVAVSVLLMLIALATGLVVSFNARSEFQAVQFVPLVILPQIFLSDLVWTLDGFPVGFRWFAQLLPLTHANAIMRGLLLQQRTLLDLWPQLLALVGLLAAALALLAWEGRRKGGASPEE
jgi:ABC-2 type transport system permease protein